MELLGEGSAPPLNNIIGPDGNTDGPACSKRVVEKPRVARAIEVINGENMPSIRTLSQADSLLISGNRIAFVGGSDAHTSMPTIDIARDFNVLGKKINLPTLSPVKHDEFNYDRIGTVGRTYVNQAARDIRPWRTGRPPVALLLRHCSFVQSRRCSARLQSSGGQRSAVTASPKRALVSVTESGTGRLG